MREKMTKNGEKIMKQKRSDKKEKKKEKMMKQQKW